MMKINKIIHKENAMFNLHSGKIALFIMRGWMEEGKAWRYSVLEVIAITYKGNGNCASVKRKKRKVSEE